MRSLVRGERLVHMSENIYVPGTVLGPWPQTAWAAAWSETQKQVEDELEKARPAEAPNRGACAFATADMNLIRSWLRKNERHRVYDVRVADSAVAWGHGDMRYLDWMTSNGPSAAHAVAYWRRKSNPTEIASWEVLSEQLVIVSEVPHVQVDYVRRESLGISLTIEALFQSL